MASVSVASSAPASASAADSAEPAVVLLAVHLQEEAEVEQRARQQPPVAKEQRDQQASQTAVAVEVGVQGLELCVQEANPDEWRQVAVIVDGTLELAEQLP